MKPSVHVAFTGDCEEAFRYYEKHLGGKIRMLMRHGEAPGEAHGPPEWKQKVMHASLELGEGSIMGVDAAPGHYEKPQGFSITIDTANPAEAERMFAALADGGKVSMAMQQTFFAVKFGMVRDRFNIPWIVICEKAA
jgi:PhnB protein